MQHQIVGTTMPVVEFALDHNDAVISEAGELSWMSQSIQMTTHTQHAGGGGFLGVIKRVAGGGTLFMTEYRAYGAPGTVAFATRVPGHIVPVEVAQGHEYMVHRHGFLCATAGIVLGGGIVKDLAPGETLRVHPGHVGAFHSNVSFQIQRVPGIRNLIFGGDGIFLAALTGPGRVWLQTLPIQRLAHQLQDYMKVDRVEQNTEAGVIGGVIGSVLKGL
jgi:uncharacterized protein (AIM24 family)